MTDTITTPRVITDPQMRATIGGYGVTEVGDSGDMLILGQPSPLRAAAIFLLHARLNNGLYREDFDLRDPITPDELSGLMDMISHRWGRFTEHPDGWWCDYEATEPGPGLLPVTVMLV